MKKNNKKGFTIVELVIVIAVIAILAAVLIPTFSSVIKKAKVNNDIQLVRNLNTALATDNKKHETMQDALDAAAEFGYDVAKINASATDNEILWDSVNDVFCYLKDGEIEYIPNSVSGTASLNANDYRLWKISNTVDDTYSTYYTGSATTINTSKGFDAGTTTGITAINYTNNGAQQNAVVIRTNGGKLTIDAKNDTIHHYGDIENLKITAVDTNSYHEYGKVGFVSIAKGRFVSEVNSKVIALLSTGADVVISQASQGSIVAAYTTVANNNTNGNTTLTLKEAYADENNTELKDIIYNAEAQVLNAIMVNGVYYKTIGDAFMKGPKDNGDGFDLSGNNTIVLLRDIEDSAFLLPDKNNGGDITIDFNGFTYTVNSTVGSTGTTTQAMHLGAAKDGKTVSFVMKNGTFTTKAGVDGMAMALQNYVKFSAENMIFDLSNIPVLHYGENEFSGIYEKYNGKECSTFNNNTTEQMVLKDCTLIFPNQANYCIGVGSSLKLVNTKITGAVSLQAGEKLLVDSNSTISKGVVPYFNDEGSVVSNTTENPGYTTYSLSN